MSKMVSSHQPCPVDGCGSSDAMTIYEDDTTGKQWGICFSGECPKKGKAIYFDAYKEDWSDVKDDIPTEAPKASKVKDTTVEGSAWAEYVNAKPVAAIVDRGLSALAMERYGVRETKRHYLFPYFDKDSLIGVKRRGVKEKTFDSLGKVSKTMLFGQQAFTPGAKTITVHTGEFDAVAGYQIHGCKYANVSVPNGDATAIECLKANFDYLNSFQTVYLSFDADESAQKQIEACAALFGDKAKIVKMDKDLKDANGYLQAGKEQEYVHAWWNAQIWVPDGIVAGNSLWDRINQPLAKPIIEWPWQGMNDKLYGIYPRRLYTLTAGSGVGKTQVVREVAYHCLKETNENIGIMMLEESVEESARGFMSLYLNKPLHVPTTEYTPEEFKDAYDNTHGTDVTRIYYHDHFGSTGINNILDRVSYLIRVRGCRFVFLDHLSIIVSAQENGDERKAIDEIMTRLRMLVQATGATLFLVCHLSKKQGKVYTEGAQVSGSDLRGSASIEQLSDCIIGCERNGQHTDDVIANTTNLRIIKSRSFGRLGLANGLYYNHDTGRMTECGIVDTTEDDKEEPL